MQVTNCLYTWAITSKSKDFNMGTGLVLGENKEFPEYGR
jgi:hypothetical protein